MEPVFGFFARDKIGRAVFDAEIEDGACRGGRRRTGGQSGHEESGGGDTGESAPE